jgi:uncharacterized protein (DUF2267 family)
MRYNDFVERVAEANPERSHQDAAHVEAQAVLEAMRPHLTREEAADLAAVLPEDLSPALDGTGPEPAAQADTDLAARIVERVGVAEDEAAGYARAVGTALAEVLDADDYERIMQSLPEGLRTQIR